MFLIKLSKHDSQIPGKNFKPFWSTLSPLSKHDGLRDIGHIMSIRNLRLSVSSVTVSYLIHYDSLLQNATDIITKYDS